MKQGGKKVQSEGKPRSSKAKAAQTMRQDEQPQDEEVHPPQRVCRKEGFHQAMASYGGSSGSGGRDGGRDREDRRVPHHFDDPADDDADEDARRKRKPGWLMRRGKSTKKNEENEEVGSILHSTKSPNLSFQRIYEQGYKPRRLFVHNQGGQSTGQDAPVLVGPGDSPHECMQNVQAAKAMAKAITAIRDSQEASANSSMPRLQLDRLFQSAAMAVEQVEQARDRGDDLQGSPQAGGSSSGSRMSAEQAKGKGKTKAPMEAIQAYLEAKGKNPKGKGGKGKDRPHEDEEEPAGELSEESPRTLDPVIEGAAEDEDGSGAADGASAREEDGSTADEGRDATAAGSAATATAADGHGDGADGGPVEGEAAEASATVEAGNKLCSG